MGLYWLFKMTDERRMRATEMYMLRWMPRCIQMKICGVTRLIRNDVLIFEVRLEVPLVKIRTMRLSWCGYMLRRDNPSDKEGYHYDCEWM